MTNKAEVCGWQPKGNSEDIPKPPKFNTDKLSVEKLQEQLNTAKYFFKNILDVNPNLNKGHVSHLENCVRVMKNSAQKALAAIGGDDE